MPHKRSKWSNHEMKSRIRGRALRLMKNRMHDAKRVLRDVRPSQPVGSGGEKVVINDHPEMDVLAGDVMVDPKIRPCGYIHPHFKKLQSIADGVLWRIIEHLAEAEDKQQNEESYNLMGE